MGDWERSEAIERAADERDELREQIRELVEALRPFAERSGVPNAEQLKARALVAKYGGTND